MALHCKEKEVNGRKDYSCAFCHQIIPIGIRHHVVEVIDDGEFSTTRRHLECRDVEWMLRDEHGDWDGQCEIGDEPEESLALHGIEVPAFAPRALIELGYRTDVAEREERAEKALMASERTPERASQFTQDRKEMWQAVHRLWRVERARKQIVGSTDGKAVAA
ncbi:hypothetical protein SAMN06297251_10476 [Fulvimarina manganoxydans]|uniref:Uncharacterized protein n=1 Tax=Fulvimarina manganoxydans TaxID=937218 RepID=A0A1W2ACL1_9HYPH|nr:hypothetical protein [Fulvimarina manganoxydans]SMC58396.1 hypothetical protein SAMN06297251_10476 [Fulvimarina manganoxydans]